MLSDEEVHRVAQRMLADFDAHRPNEIFAERNANWLTIDEAYAVQRAVAELRQARGERRLGYKVGCVSPAIQNQLGLSQPVHGSLWDTASYQSGCHLPVARFVNLAIEGEIALRLGRDIPTNLPTRPDDLIDFIECWFPVIELHNHIFRGDKPTSQELVAGNAMHAGFIAPAAPGTPNLAALDRAEIRVEIDGVLAERESVANLAGGPLGSLRWLASALAQDGRTLRAGTLVLTGSPGQLIPIKPGCSVSVAAGEEQVRCSCTADPPRGG